MLEDPTQLLAPALSFVVFALSMTASGHALLYKRDSRSASFWVGLVWLVPVVGAALYAVFGINRIRRRAMLLRATEPEGVRSNSELVESRIGPDLQPLVRLGDRVTRHVLLGGNRVTLLRDGDQTYPDMLAAIDQARHSIGLVTYIFDNDPAGWAFLEALQRAVERGVRVRVLVDDLGNRYSLKPMHRRLARAGIPVARFLPTHLPWRLPYLNLRNHRKILVVDGRIGWTGGMNIRAGNLRNQRPDSPIQDLQARVEGPVVRHLQETFVEDWAFCTGELLDDPDWFPTLETVGSVVARGIVDGPDGSFESLQLTLLGALTAARRRVAILTPYFVPNPALLTSLGVAAMRGVEVDIVLPTKSNLSFVDWATRSLLWQVLERGCRGWLTPPPFDHAKLMVVDGEWTLLGSANWDARSLRLNFEFQLECFDVSLALEAQGEIDQRLRSAERLFIEDVDGRSLAVRLRDGGARLLSPFL